MLQKIINYIYRHPRSNHEGIMRIGGYFSYLKMQVALRSMKRSATKLPPIVSHSDGLPIYFLTGKKYLYQTLFCIHSLTSVAPREKFRYILIDDSSFDDVLLSRIKLQLPGAEIITSDTIYANLKTCLPIEEFPRIYKKREVYPHIKKLVDIHTIPGSRWKLVLDSDMLFWHSPQEIIDWLKNPTEPICMTDCVESYGYSSYLMEKIVGCSIPQMLNVGVIGLSSPEINWSAVEEWIISLEENEGASYYLEQALTAMLLAKSKFVQLPGSQYLVNPSLDDVATKRGILHHYVDVSKKHYFNRAWHKLVE